MKLDVPATLASLAHIRSVFHSEADFQHSLAWQIHLADPDAQVRLETRSARNIRLDLLVMSAGQRTAIELKYLVASFRGDIGGEHYDLPNQAAQDFGRSTRDVFLRGVSGGRQQRVRGRPGTGRNGSFSPAATSAAGATTRSFRTAAAASTAGATLRFGFQGIARARRRRRPRRRPQMT